MSLGLHLSIWIIQILVKSNTLQHCNVVWSTWWHGGIKSWGFLVGLRLRSHPFYVFSASSTSSISVPIQILCRENYLVKSEIHKRSRTSVIDIQNLISSKSYPPFTYISNKKLGNRSDCNFIFHSHVHNKCNFISQMSKAINA